MTTLNELEVKVSNAKGTLPFKEVLAQGKFFVTHIRRGGYTFLCHSVGHTVKTGPNKGEYRLTGVAVVQVPKRAVTEKRQYRARIIPATKSNETLDTLDEMIKLDKRQQTRR